MRRIISIAAAILVIGMVIAVVLPVYADYTPRANVTAAVVFIGKGRAALELSCADGSFSSKQKLIDIGLPESDPKAYVLRAELVRIGPGAARLKTVLTDIYGRPFFGLFPWKVIPQGSMIEYEFTCSAEKKLTSGFFASTVEPKYLPASLRAR